MASKRDYRQMKMEHPTEKPPLLYEKSLRRCSRPRDIILDETAGSGSLMVACEQLKRTAYLVDVEPIFCQLILNRYEKLTNTKPKIILNPELYPSSAEHRLA